jgi:hypothetical protein
VVFANARKPAMSSSRWCRIGTTTTEIGVCYGALAARLLCCGYLANVQNSVLFVTPTKSNAAPRIRRQILPKRVAT